MDLSLTADSASPDVSESSTQESTTPESFSESLTLQSTTPALEPQEISIAAVLPTEDFTQLCNACGSLQDLGFACCVCEHVVLCAACIHHYSMGPDSYVDYQVCSQAFGLALSLPQVCECRISEGLSDEMKWLREIGLLTTHADIFGSQLALQLDMRRQQTPAEPFGVHRDAKPPFSRAVRGI